MRVAVFTNQFPGPTSTFFARDMRGLIEAGVEIEVLPLYPVDSNFWHYIPEILNEKVLPRRKVHHLTVTECLRTASTAVTSRKVGRLLSDSFRITASASRFGVDSLWKTSYSFLTALAWAKQFPDGFDHILAYWGNYAATAAYIYHRLNARQSPYSIFLHAGIDLFHQPIYLQQKLKYADNIVTCSEFNRQFIKERFPNLFDEIANKIFVHHHGVDFRKLTLRLDGRPSGKVIAVGRLASYKGYDYLLRAIYELKQRGTMGIDVEFVGDGPQLGALKSLATALGVHDRTRFRGWLASDEACAAIQQATVLVHPSPELNDGVPNVIKEAMAVGTPVIGSNIAGIPELLDKGRCGMIVPPRDVMALANAIESLLANPSMRVEYAEAAYSYAQRKFDLWQNGQLLAHLLTSSKGVQNNQTLQV